MRPPLFSDHLSLLVLYYFYSDLSRAAVSINKWSSGNNRERRWTLNVSQLEILLYLNEVAVYEKSYCTLLRILSSIHTPAAERRIFKSHSAVTVYKRHIGNNVKTQGCRDFRLRYRLGCEGTLSTQTNVTILTFVNGTKQLFVWYKYACTPPRFITMDTTICTTGCHGNMMNILPIRKMNDKSSVSNQ